jgi:hypothetical protein
LGLPYTPMEVLIPLTSVNKSLVGDRYGEMCDFVQLTADYVSQVRWDMNEDYYWWLNSDGMRKTRQMRQPAFSDVIARYGVETPSLEHHGVDYRDFLKFLDRHLLPQSYLEIGTHQGDSVSNISCDAILIDPNFKVNRDIIGKRSRTFFFQMTSDEFFESHDPRALVKNIDLGFLDGLHFFEALLKDFINYERHAHSNSIALLHDCLPLNLRMVGRNHVPGPDTEPEATRSFWTGDVWRVLPILHQLRPDLKIVYIDCPPTGLVLCAGLDARSTGLIYKYREMVERYSNVELGQYGLRELWSLFPTLSSQKIVTDPMVFCDFFSVRPAAA